MEKSIDKFIEGYLQLGDNLQKKREEAFSRELYPGLWHRKFDSLEEALLEHDFPTNMSGSSF